MDKPRYFFQKPDLIRESRLESFVENQTKFSMNNCEFSVYETHRSAYGVKLHFKDLAFTGMLRGKKLMKLEDKTSYFDYVPGESVLVSPGETMVIDFPEADETPSQCISVCLNPDFVKESLCDLNLTNPMVDENSQWKITPEEFFLFNNQSLASATNNIMRIAMDNNVHKDIMADFALKELLIRLMQTQARKMVEKNIHRTESRLGAVVEHIRKNLHEKLTVDHLSKIAYLSKSNFFKIFRQELGVSPNEFIITERVKRAKELLAVNSSVKETAYLTGFADTNYFIRVFKQLEGVTPKIYQNKRLLFN